MCLTIERFINVLLYTTSSGLRMPQLNFSGKTGLNFHPHNCRVIFKHVSKAYDILGLVRDNL